MIVGDKVVLEKKENNKEKLNLLLDLDSTIIYSKKYKKGEKIIYENEFDINVLCEYEMNDGSYQIYLRNFSIDFLKNIKEKFNLYIYTMGNFQYASVVCNSIENLLGEIIFNGIVARHGNHYGQQKYFHVLQYLNEKNTIIIDDNKDIWLDEHKNNLIKIKEFKYKSYDNYIIDDDLYNLSQLFDLFHNNNLEEMIQSIILCYEQNLV
jgi:TFIIF-interacting CTD phosphatase-like protein